MYPTFTAGSVCCVCSHTDINSTTLHVMKPGKNVCYGYHKYSTDLQYKIGTFGKFADV